MLKTLINQHLGRYLIKDLLGRGGMAAVYRAADTALQRDVALKVLYPQYGDDQSLVERFTREAVTAAALEHPNIVPVYDVGEHDGMAYIAMKLLSGETLHDLLLRDGTLSLAALCQILGPVADALDYAHSRGVIHRDIKPGNIFLSQTASSQLQVMLTDFGIAKRLDTPGITTTGALIGTPHYMAPEQIAGRPIDARTDVYALGMLAYRALTGRYAFEGNTQDVLMGHLYQQPAPPSSVSNGVNPDLDPVLLRAIATDRNARWGSAGAFVCAMSDVTRAVAVGYAPTLPPVAAVAQIAHVPADAINSVPTRVSIVAEATPAKRVVTTQARESQVPIATHTTLIPASRATPTEPRGSMTPWLLAITLALIAGGLAVALGFMVGGRQTGGVTGSVVLPTTSPSPTPPITAVPTLLPTATLGSTDGASVIQTPEPSPSATPRAANPVAPTRTIIVPTPNIVHTITVEPTASTTPSPAPSETPSPTPSETPSPTPSETPSPTPSETPSPTLSETPSPSADCSEGRLTGGFGQLYRTNVGVRNHLGCPKESEHIGKGSEQFFASGTMFYWGLNPTGLRDTIIVFSGLTSGSYATVSADEAARYPDPPSSSDPNAPIRGFGRVYYGKVGVAEALGAWTSPEIELKESSNPGVIQFFDDGAMIYTPIYQQPGAGNQAIFVLYADGAFERYNDPPAK